MNLKEKFNKYRTSLTIAGLLGSFAFGANYGFNLGIRATIDHFTNNLYSQDVPLDIITSYNPKADINNDGKQDLLLYGEDGSCRIFLQTEEGKLEKLARAAFYQESSPDSITGSLSTISGATIPFTGTIEEVLGIINSTPSLNEPSEIPIDPKMTETLTF